METGLLAELSAMPLGDAIAYLTGGGLLTGGLGAGGTHLFHRRRSGGNGGSSSPGCPHGLDVKIDVVQTTVQNTSRDVGEMKQKINSVADDFGMLKEELFKAALRGRQEG